MLKTKILSAIVYAVLASWSTQALSSPALSTPVSVADEKTVAAFRADLAAKFKAADEKHDSVVLGKDGWMFFAPELRSVSVGKFWGEDAAKVSRAVNPAHADPLPAILDFKAQLDKIGVQLLLVPVPPKAVIFADKISDKIASPVGDGVLPRLDSAHQEFYKLLREKGVNVLDLTDSFLKNRDAAFFGRETQKLFGPDYVFCRQDTHWSPNGIKAASYLIKQEIDNSEVKTPSKYTSFSRPFPIKGDLLDALPPEVKRPEPESLFISRVGTPDPKVYDPFNSILIPIPTSRESPVLLLGDSHTLIFHEGGDMHAKGAGLPDHLARFLGYPVDLLGVRGSGATPARVSLLRRVQAEPNYLKNKKWVIWCFSAREFTESAGWQKVPLGIGK